MIFKTVVATLFTLSGLAPALAATPAYYIAEFQATDLDAIKPRRSFNCTDMVLTHPELTATR
ncbi:hypothetical protein [Klebsiella aerogenes]|uniref:hypothetical protein n=1 Tax=Klebsiella aerogenes TaxID=548 RepID=UPI001F5B37EC|nr:hypothetical protein [Klebsiella aerogenes]